MILTKGQKIVVVEDNELKHGTIRDLYEKVGIAIVDFGEGLYKKVHIDKIAICDEKTAEIDKPVEKSEITITPSEFMEITTNVIGKLAHEVDYPIEFMGACSILLGRIHKALFIEDSNDVDAV